jgi:CRISPR-associated protein Csm3
MYGKLLITCDLIVKTGLHIGGSSAYSAIGAIDSPVIRDLRTGLPIVPGSSLKGKLRTLLARSFSQDIENMPDFKSDDSAVLRLFGSSEKPIQKARLQFSDAYVNNEESMRKVGLTEIKTENVIDRGTCVAMPRQIERVTAGTSFHIPIVYEYMDQEQARQDLGLLAKGMKLLQLDYLGGHGTRGSGRVSFENFQLSTPVMEQEVMDINTLKNLFKEVEDYELFSV